ncbi:SusC/RagA family TonB-linked outer membrane protein [Prevotella denticola]
MKIFKETKQKHLYFSAAFAFSLALAPAGAYAGSNARAAAVQAVQQNGNHKVTGRVVDSTGEPLIGATVLVEGTTNGTVTDIDGNFTINTPSNAKLVFSYIGYVGQSVAVNGKNTIDVTLKEESSLLKEVVVTAMGIQRKEESLTYATQKVKAEDLMKVQDPNVANSLEGKVSGLTITPSAGGAGGSTKIVLRGAKSILGSSSPLIVVDGVPMTNDARGKRDMAGEGFTYAGMSEGSDPLSLINPDDIESINVLKGANAAALYGSVAANGVVMITTKRGREGKLDINVTSNITFDSPLLTPKIQNTYGATMNGNTIQADGWGLKIGSLADNQLTMSSPLNSTNFQSGAMHDIHLRNHAQDDVKDFFRTGVTTNNSLSLSGGTEKMTTYFSMANSHSTGLLRNNNYNRNTFSLRQSYRFFNRLKVDLSLNYAQTITRNRPGGGTVGNPLYHLYLTPRNVDMDYYRNNYVTQDGKWLSGPQNYYELSGGSYSYTTDQAKLQGPRQNWAFMNAANNNPYWLINMNQSKQKEDRIWGTISGNVDIYDGLSFQARINYDHTRYKSTSKRYATTFLPASMEDYGRFWDSDSKTTEIYIDYLLNYNKTFGDFDLSATAGWVGHTIKGEYKGTDVIATYYDRTLQKLPTKVNYFDTSAGGMGATSSSKSSNWDRAWLATAQMGWKDMVFVDASYRRDWYRPFRYFKLSGISNTDNYGYFGIGANAILSKLLKLPEPVNYLKYRASYSEVGNSIPNIAYNAVSTNLQTGAINGSNYAQFVDPRPEKTRSFETGVESLWFNNRLSFDLTYYNATMSHLYMTAATGTGLTKNMNSAKVRNQGIEMTLGYDFKPVSWLRWRTSFNLSYNKNKILKTAYDEQGKERLIEQKVGGVHVKYMEGGSIGDMYVPDFDRDENGHIKLNSLGQPQFDKSGKLKYIGNMNANWQMGWSNTFTWKDLSLSFLINGRIGGKVISLTEQQLDYYGYSQRSADARLEAEKNNIVAKDYGNVPGMMLPDGSGRIVPVQSYYQAIGSADSPADYVYNATNFRMRELSLGYTFRNLFGMNRNLALSFIARNLFFIYKDAPTDPDVSLSTTNGLGAFELFNTPSTRSYGFSLKMNF